MSKVNILIIEDDPAVALALEILIQRTSHTIMAVIDGPGEALHFMENNTPDLIIMNTAFKTRSNGLQLIRQTELQQLPILCIPDFKTPGERQNMRSSIISKLGILFGGIPQEDNGEDCTLKDSIFLKKGYSFFKVPFTTILYIKAEGDYCELQTTSGKFIHKASLVKLLDNLPKRHFLKIHRSYIIHLQHIEHVSLSRNEITVSKFPVPVGRTYKAALLECLQRIE